MSRPEAFSPANAYELLIQGVVDYAIFMLDPEGRVATWNAGAERIKGHAASEIVGQHFSRFYTPEDTAAGLPWEVLETARREGHFEAEGWRVRKDGTRFWASVVVDAIYNDGKLVGFAKITRDLTERREAQLELERSREQLFQAQKMEAVGQLTGGLAHDFNNLLTGITGSLERLQTRLAQGRLGDLDRYVTAAQGAARRAAALTQRLLAFARRQTLDPKPTDINRLIAGMEELIRRTMGPAVELEVVGAAGLWTALIDPNQLESALLNLCINARDAMPEGGRLTVETANKWLDERAGRERDLPPGQYLSLCVTDTGTGMTPDVARRAFEPFFTTKPTGLGTGLGLSMVYGFARQSGGQVRIYSEVGQGTTVCLYLPRHHGQEGSPESPAGSGEAPRAGQGETVKVAVPSWRPDVEGKADVVEEVVRILGVDRVPPTPFDPGLVATVRGAAEAQAYPYQDIISGAGHDAVYLARVAPTAMIFVPCVGGISHNEIEDAKPDDLAAGCNVLLNAMLDRADAAT